MFLSGVLGACRLMIAALQSVVAKTAPAQLCQEIPRSIQPGLHAVWRHCSMPCQEQACHEGRMAPVIVSLIPFHQWYISKRQNRHPLQPDTCSGFLKMVEGCFWVVRHPSILPMAVRGRQVVVLLFRWFCHCDLGRLRFLLSPALLSSTEGNAKIEAAAALVRLLLPLP